MVKLAEKTHEEFEAQAFDLDSETLTLAFNGQSFDLTLQESSGSSGLPQPAVDCPKLPYPKESAPSAVGKKVMPPRPKVSHLCQNGLQIEYPHALLYLVAEV